MILNKPPMCIWTQAEHGKGIVFLHKVEEGAANQSYGIQVAQLAGIPKSVVASAKRKLIQLEHHQLQQNEHQPDMFAAHEIAPQAPLASQLLKHWNRFSLMI
jgi:DNA mismatch repair protein MutS